MSVLIYKPGQGYWTRLLSALGAGTVILWAAWWLWNQLAGRGVYAQATVAVIVIAVVGGLSFWIMNRPKVVDFFVATEAEMRKVNWPGKREIVLSTWIVIAGTFMMALLVWVVDILFLFIFIMLNIIQGRTIFG
jgi:preprotein translocase subunit SecE